MRILICCIGRMKAGAERELVARYLDRAKAGGRALGLSGFDVSEHAESSARRPEDRMAEEGGALLSAVPPGARLCLLDPRGKSLTSEDFAARIGRERDSGTGAFACFIGGADGLSPQVREKADLLLSFGAATFPHQLVRVMLAEQIYRATTILSGHPYHRA
ncbi:23S rRNA (pseudouridine(1915)-N(3))-methyltransferase RlmH [Aquabacter cavernae]|uniref:23S rRNA (pseudouridine(1915)-N(3))-methyltransferase RlmH n=1 Tax=Aquabacter cavernae TaxID=2496029 RepID=UPI000F8CB8CD|nr:23S rRNA (pseudouridine(1915)-N(3))-methyltransferase RlmH [Aquabacter cavernae]